MTDDTFKNGPRKKFCEVTAHIKSAKNIVESSTKLMSNVVDDLLDFI